jgi:predicted lysophospholipase L1 biosynthesis ABC-type transport system permease subunit
VPAIASANLVARFLCELAALAALAVWGAQASDDPAVKVLLGVTAPLLLAAVWGMWVAPRSARRAPDPLRAGIEVLVFGAAVAGLVDAGHTAFAVALAVLAAITGALVRVWPEPGAERPTE